MTISTTNSKTFRFKTDETSLNHATNWCDITIMVKIDGEQYHITYENKFSNKNTKLGTIDSSHPFYYNKDLHEHMDGDIIIKNEMTEKMIQMLMMDSADLEKYTGLSTPERYRSNIMCSLTYFWD